MRTVHTLIDDAVKVCGSVTELAHRIGVNRAQIACWRSGSEPISPENVAMLCDVLQLSGEETRRLAAEAIVANPKNEKRRETLRRAFFVGWASGVVGFSLLAFHPSSDAVTHSHHSDMDDRTQIVPSRWIGPFFGPSAGIDRGARHGLMITDGLTAP